MNFNPFFDKAFYNSLFRHPLSLCLVANAPSKEDFPKIKKFQDLLQNTQSPFFINTLNLIEVASQVKPDGVYLEENLCITAARRHLGKKTVIGIFFKTTGDVLAARKNSLIDYLSIKVFSFKKTCPKTNPNELWGLDGLRKVCSLSSTPNIRRKVRNS